MLWGLYGCVIQENNNTTIQTSECSDYYVSEHVAINFENSSLSDFEIQDDRVYIYCFIEIRNAGPRKQLLKLNAKSRSDVSNGLLSDENLIGYQWVWSEETTTVIVLPDSDIIEIPENSTEEYRIAFVGKSGGGQQKANRLLPGEIIGEIIPDGT